MAVDEKPKRPRGRRGIWRRRSRESVPSGPGNDPRFDDGDEDGSAGVREPRRPKPRGPVSGAGALPEPEPSLVVSLPDPRR